MTEVDINRINQSDRKMQQEGKKMRFTAALKEL
jgi:hypothetical protein